MQSNRYSNPSHPPPCNREDKSCFLSKLQVKDGRISQCVIVSRGTQKGLKGEKTWYPNINLCMGKKKKINPWKTTSKNPRNVIASGSGSQKMGLDFYSPPRGHLTASGNRFGGQDLEEEGRYWCRVARGYQGYCPPPQGTGLPHSKDLAPHATGPTLRIPGLRILFWGFTQFIYPGHLTSSSRALLRTSDPNPQREAPGLSLSFVSLVLAQARPGLVITKAAGHQRKPHLRE